MVCELDDFGLHQKAKEKRTLDNRRLRKDEDVRGADSREVRNADLVQIGPELAIEHIAWAEHRFCAHHVYTLALSDDVCCARFDVFQAQVRRISSLPRFNFFP